MFEFVDNYHLQFYFLAAFFHKTLHDNFLGNSVLEIFVKKFYESRILQLIDRRYFTKRCSEYFCNIHIIAPVPESPFQ